MGIDERHPFRDYMKSHGMSIEAAGIVYFADAICGRLDLLCSMPPDNPGLDDQLRRYLADIATQQYELVKELKETNRLLRESLPVPKKAAK